VIPETLNRIADLLNEIASEAERLAETEHEAETTEKLCELVSESLMASYDRHIGRA